MSKLVLEPHEFIRGRMSELISKAQNYSTTEDNLYNELTDILKDYITNHNFDMLKDYSKDDDDTDDEESMMMSFYYLID